MTRRDLRVMVVDDDFRVAALHAKVVETMPGLTAVGSARTVAEAEAILRDGRIDLALVDVYLPDGSGIDLVRRMRCDAFILGAADDSASVLAANSAGALHYLIKPFTSVELARRLGGYSTYRRILSAPEVTQAQLDAAMSALRPGPVATRREEPGSVTGRRIVDVLRESGEAMLADDIATRMGISAATARRHLADLVRDGTLRMSLQYGATGRPRQKYVLAAQQSGPPASG